MPSGLKWADRNVRATSPYDQGPFFQWGNVVGQPFGCSARLFDQGWYESHYAAASFTTDLPVGDEYDMARFNMGTPWRMPTRADALELFANTDQEFVFVNGVYCSKLMKKTDHSVYILLPETDYCVLSGVKSYSTGYGSRLFYYFTSTVANAQNAYIFNATRVTSDAKYIGFGVRGVCD